MALRHSAHQAVRAAPRTGEVRGCPHGGRWMVEVATHRAVLRPCSECERSIEMSHQTARHQVPRRGFLGTLRTAVFGVTRPGRWFRRALEAPAEQIDPARSDVRAVYPAEPPEEVLVNAGGREMAAQDEHVNPELVDRRRERGG